MKGKLHASQACGRIAMVAMAAVVLTFGTGVTSAHAERVIQNSDGQVVEQDQPDVTGQEGIEVVEATEGDPTAEGEQNVGGDAAAESVDAPKGPKVAPQLEVRGPKVGGDPNATYPSIDAPKVVITDAQRDYIDEKGEPATSPVGCKDLSGSKTGWLPLKSGWYCFTKDAELEGRGSIEGDVRIILCDGAKVTWTGGLHTCAGSKLTIYGQKEGTGELFADNSTSDNETGIGGNQGEPSTEVTICGGHVTAKGGYYGAGIGGGAYIWHPFKSNEPAGNCGKVTIYGGEVEAFADRGAGIGSGANANGAASGPSVGGGIVTIKGGRVSAKARGFGAGIGGGENSGSCDLVLIESATVTAVSECSGAGIGGGGSAANMSGSGRDGGKVIIRNAKVDASSHEGAGIGGGGDRHGARGGDLTIEGASTVRCQSRDGAAIGRGADGPEDGNGRLSIPDDMRVVTLDADDGVSEEDRNEGKGKAVPAAERAAYCHYRNDVLLEPCSHAETTCKQVEGGHKSCCKYCKAEFETEAHSFDAEGRCGQCGYKRPMPKFADPTWEAADGIKLVFRVELPEAGMAACEGARMEMVVGGKRRRTLTLDCSDAQADAEGRLLFPVELSTVEMAETVKATLALEDGVAVAQETSLVEALFQDAVRPESERCGLSSALMDAGRHLQRYLCSKNGLRLGVDYAEVRTPFGDTLDVDGVGDALKGFVVRVDKGDSKFKKVTMCVEFGATVSVDVYVTCEPGTKAFSAASLRDGAPKPRREADGRYHIRVEGIAPKDFGRNLQVVGNADGGFRIDLSVLSYANACFQKKDAKPEEKAAMAAVYRLWEACQ